MFFTDDAGDKRRITARYQFASYELTVNGDTCWKTRLYIQHYAYIDANPDVGKIHTLAYVQLTQQEK